MTDVPKAWVWDLYQGVISETNAKGAVKEKAAEDRVVRFRTIQGSGDQAMGQNATERRAKYGLSIAVSILIGAFFPLIAVFLFLVAALLIFSGREPKRAEDLLGQVPGGDHIRKAMVKVDEYLS